jgi:hypothetical protein
MADDTLIDFLESLSGHGIYNVGIIGELEQFGFAYDKDSDLLSLGLLRTTLNARTPEALQIELDADPKGGILDKPRLQGKVIDATDITSAIIRLIAPGTEVPSTTFYGRGKGYKADVAFIARTWRAN